MRASVYFVSICQTPFPTQKLEANTNLQQLGLSQVFLILPASVLITKNEIKRLFPPNFKVLSQEPVQGNEQQGIPLAGCLKHDV